MMLTEDVRQVMLYVAAGIFLFACFAIGDSFEGTGKTGELTDAAKWGLFVGLFFVVLAAVIAGIALLWPSR